MKPFLSGVLAFAIFWWIASSKGPLAIAGLAALFNLSPSAFITLSVILAILISIN